MFADDTGAICQTRREVQLTADVTVDFATKTGLQINEGKSFAFTTVVGGRKRVRLEEYARISW
eukprot:11438268-Karenia_brevis.AAC.1